MAIQCFFDEILIEFVERSIVCKRWALLCCWAGGIIRSCWVEPNFSNPALQSSFARLFDAMISGGKLGYLPERPYFCFPGTVYCAYAAADTDQFCSEIL